MVAQPSLSHCSGKRRSRLKIEPEGALEHELLNMSPQSNFFLGVHLALYKVSVLALALLPCIPEL